MARFDYVQTNFTRGELSPRLQGRIDFQGFFNGVEVLQNMLVLPHGGVMKRPGTRFVGSVSDQTKPARLLPFEFSVEETYILALNDEVMRFYLNEGELVTNDLGGASITNGTFDSDLSGWSDISNGSGSVSQNNGQAKFDGDGSGNEARLSQSVSISNTNTVHTLRLKLENRSEQFGFFPRLKIGSSQGATDLKDIDLAFGTHVVDFDPGGNSTVHVEIEYSGSRTITLDNVVMLDNQPVEIEIPWDGQEIFTLKWVQSADVMWICHPDFFPRQLKRFGTTEFSLEFFDFVDGPYDEVNNTGTTLTPDATGLNTIATITASDTKGINGDQGFKANDFARWVRLKQNGKWGAGQIISVNSPTSVGVVIRDKDFDATTATADWRLGSWSSTTGWPEVPTFHDQRLIFGSSPSEPQALWMSKVGNFRNFAPTERDGSVLSDNGINVTISSSQVNAIRWLESLNAGLAVGTSGAEFLVRSATTTDPLGPDSIEVERNTNRGSADAVLPAKIGHSLMFVQRGNRVIRELAFDFDIDGLKARDFSIVSEHLLRPRIVRLAYQQNKDSILWALRADARLIGFTIESDQEVFAWHQHTLGGTFGDDDAFIESIGAIQESDIDQIWMVVRRDIDGVPTRYVEFMEEPWLQDQQPIEDAFFVDSGLTGTFGSPTSTVGGLDHLEGETVDVLADGSAHPQRVVQNGQIDLEFEATKVQVGLPYTAGFRTFPFNTGTEGDVMSGKIKRIHKLHVLFFDTVGAKYGYDPNELDTVQFRDSSMAMDQPVPPFTGTKDLNFPMRHDQDAYMIVRSDQPLPMTVLSAAASMEFYRDAGGQQ